MTYPELRKKIQEAYDAGGTTFATRELLLDIVNFLDNSEIKEKETSLWNRLKNLWN